MGNKLQAYKLLHSGVLALQKSSYSGIHIDLPYCKQMNAELTSEIDTLEKEILESELGKIWTELIDPEEFKIDSTAQLGKVLYGEMKIKPVKFTPKDKPSVDEEALIELNMPVLDKLIHMRKLKKVRDTYMGQFLSEHTNGILHPNFNLHTVKTFRSSSSRPNFQNIPKHGRFAHLVRRAFIPTPGHQFLEIDYSGLEVRIAASVVDDMDLRKDVLEGDMHRDVAMDLYCLEDFDYMDKGDKQLRYGAKNGFVFAQFYGSYYKQCVPIILKHAEDVDLKIGCTAWENLANLGYIKLSERGLIVDDSNYYDHVQGVEEAFWAKYKKYDQWKKIQYKRYLKSGKVDFPTGFEIYGKMRKNEVLNAPIQGSAFHALLLAFIMINNVRMKERWRTKMVGQVHDSIMFDVHPDELTNVYETSRRIMEEDIMKIFKWITVPMKVDAELFGIDEPWLEGEPYDG